MSQQYPSRYTARLAPIKFWDNPDATKRGFIPVEFWGQIVWARPIFASPGQFNVPTKEWVEENIDEVAVMVEVIDHQKGKLAWSGFTYWEDHTPEDTQPDYPYKKVIYSDEQWQMFSSTVDGESTFFLKHRDGSVLELSRGSGEGGDNPGSETGATDKRFVYFDGELGHEIRLDEDNVILYDGVNDISYKTSDEGLVITDGVNDIVLEFTGDGAKLIDGTDSTVIESTDIHLGGQKAGTPPQPVILGDNLVLMLNTVLTALATHFHPSAMGPTGPPTDAAVYATQAGLTEQLKSQVSKTD